MAEAQLDYNTSDINKGINGGMNYWDNKDNIALKEELATLNTYGNSSNGTSEIVIDLDGLENHLTFTEILLSSNNKLYLIDGNVRCSALEAIISAGSYVKIGHINDTNKRPKRMVPLNVATGGTAQVKARISQNGDIEVYSYNVDLRDFTLYITGIYR